MSMAEAPPPPLQMLAMPRVFFFSFSAYIRVLRILPPDDPIGCPIDTAPPLMLTIS